MTTEETQALCDGIVTIAAREMVRNGASVPMALDRMLTYCTAQACHMSGAFTVAELFRDIADQIENGKFSHVEPAGNGKGN